MADQSAIVFDWSASLNQEVRVSNNAYVVKFTVGNVGEPGAPILHVAAKVIPGPIVSKIGGTAEITQAVASGKIVIEGLTGEIHENPVVGPVARIATLKGHYSPDPTTPLELPFSAELELEQAEWKGTGSFAYGDRKVQDVPVTPARKPVPQAA
jgi:hypothetical protein